MDGNWLEQLYKPSELVASKKVCFPWMAKGGYQQTWNAVVVGSGDQQILPTNQPSDSMKGTELYMYVLIIL